MGTDATADRPPWETPATTPITDTESRADQSDVTAHNGPSVSTPG
jgi:hypothetical protein